MHEAERMAAIPAHIFKIARTSREVSDAMPAEHANRRVIDVCRVLLGASEIAWLAVTGKLPIAVTVRHHVHAVTEEARQR